MVASHTTNSNKSPIDQFNQLQNDLIEIDDFHNYIKWVQKDDKLKLKSQNHPNIT